MSHCHDKWHLKPPRVILENPIYFFLFTNAVESIETFQLPTLLNNAINPQNYQLLVKVAFEIAAKIFGRVVITLPDGTVAVDTTRQNTFQKFQNKTINENHNTRVAIFQAQLEKGGVGYEEKFSTSTQRTESAVGVRLGKFRDSAGTIRLSVATPVNQ